MGLFPMHGNHLTRVPTKEKKDSICQLEEISVQAFGLLMREACPTIALLNSEMHIIWLQGHVIV